MIELDDDWIKKIDALCISALVTQDMVEKGAITKRGAVLKGRIPCIDIFFRTPGASDAELGLIAYVEYDNGIGTRFFSNQFDKIDELLKAYNVKSVGELYNKKVIVSVLEVPDGKFAAGISPHIDTQASQNHETSGYLRKITE
jgi:hypothetical protein